MTRRDATRRDATRRDATRRDATKRKLLIINAPTYDSCNVNFRLNATPHAKDPPKPTGLYSVT